ncbi:MAG: hypothetical protein M1292_00765 [Bacteroidetes bacterium]|nr:hypothetical protein [Bacteroidota bacterium]
MNATETCICFDDEPKGRSIEDYTLTPSGEKYMLSQFLYSGDNERKLISKSYEASKLLQKLFKSKLEIPALGYRLDKGCVVIYKAPFAVESDTLEEEVISYYYKNSRISGNLIEIPYKSL